MSKLKSIDELKKLFEKGKHIFVVKVGGLKEWEICNDLEILSQQGCLSCITPVSKEHEEIAKAFTENPNIAIKFNCGGSWLYFDESSKNFIDTYCDVWQYEVIKYPENEKLSRNQVLIKNVSEYIEFLSEKNILSLKKGEDYLYEMLDIDSKKLESERREMLLDLKQI